MATKIVSTQDGPRLTVDQLLKSPTLIPKRVLRMMDQEFLTDAVLRKASDAPSGVVLYHESTPLFGGDDPKVMDEFGEIPTTNGELGKPLAARVVRRAMGLRVSKTMRDRNNVDAINTQITQIRNTMVRAWEDALFSAVVNSDDVWSYKVTTAWNASSSTTIRKDVNGAKYVIENASADSTGTTGKQKFGYHADTLIVSTETDLDLVSSDEINKEYAGNNNADKPLFKGTLPQKFCGLDVMVSWRLSAYLSYGAIVMQRKVFGGISDERPLQATPMYGEGNGPNGGPTESWRTDITRASAVFLDHPKAVCLLTGVNASGDKYPSTLTVNS